MVLLSRNWFDDQCWNEIQAQRAMTSDDIDIVNRWPICWYLSIVDVTVILTIQWQSEMAYCEIIEIWRYQWKSSVTDVIWPGDLTPGNVNYIVDIGQYCYWWNRYWPYSISGNSLFEVLYWYSHYSVFGIHVLTSIHCYWNVGIICYSLICWYCCYDIYWCCYSMVMLTFPLHCCCWHSIGDHSFRRFTPLHVYTFLNRSFWFRWSFTFVPLHVSHLSSIFRFDFISRFPRYVYVVRSTFVDFTFYRLFDSILLRWFLRFHCRSSFTFVGFHVYVRSRDFTTRLDDFVPHTSFTTDHVPHVPPRFSFLRFYTFSRLRSDFTFTTTFTFSFTFDFLVSWLISIYSFIDLIHYIPHSRDHSWQMGGSFICCSCWFLLLLTSHCDPRCRFVRSSSFVRCSFLDSVVVPSSPRLGCFVHSINPSASIVCPLKRV